MAFHEVRFPTAIAVRSSIAVERKTLVGTADSGAEERNTPWANSRRPYDAGYGVKSVNDMYAIIAFFEERRARLHGFRWKDALDFRSLAPGTAVAFTDQAIGIGDDNETAFQLVKVYGGVYNPWTRSIRKPVAGTVKAGVNGVEGTEGVDWSVDTTTGVVTFSSPPGNGLTVTAGFEFDVPVRFNTDRLEFDLEAFAAGQAPSVPIIELPDVEVAP